jgi:hypothetical protein
VILMAARSSRTENQDAIDATIVGMLADPKEVYVITFCFSFLCTVIILYSISYIDCLTKRLVLVFKRSIFCRSTQLTKELL